MVVGALAIILVLILILVWQGRNNTATGPSQDELDAAQKRIDQSQANLQNNPNAAKDQAYANYMALGANKAVLGKYGEARDAYWQAIGIFPDNAAPWGELYYAHNALGAYNDAKGAIDKAIELNNSNAQFWHWKIELMRDHFSYSGSQLKVLCGQALDKTTNSSDIKTLCAPYQK